MHNHYNLKAFQLAKQLAHSVYDITSAFPKQERYTLTSQVRRAALSVPSNIVEGCGRESNQELIRFLYIAHGSAKEVEFQIRFANERAYIDDHSANQILSLVTETARVIHGLIKSYQS